MKKFLIVALLVLAPVVSFATTADDTAMASLLQQLASLQKIVADLQSQLASLKTSFSTTNFPGYNANSTASTVTTPTTITANTAYGTLTWKVDANGCIQDALVLVGTNWVAHPSAIWSNGCWRLPASQNGVSASGSTAIGAGYNQTQTPAGWSAVPNAPQLNNGLNGYAFGPYAGKSLASLGTKTSAPALGSAGGSYCSLSNGWTVSYFNAQYGGQFVQYACSALSKQLMLYSLDYCTSQTECYHHDYTGQYKITRDVLEKALGHTVSTISFDPVTVDPFNPVLFTDRSLESKCVSPRNHGGQLDLYDAGCGTHTGMPTDPIQLPTYNTSTTTGAGASNTSGVSYAGVPWNQLGTKTSAPALGADGYCSISTSGEAQNWGKDAEFVNASCRMYGLGYKTWVYSVDYKLGGICYHHDYTGQYKVDCAKQASKLGVSEVKTIDAIPGSDGMNRVLFDSAYKAQCWALRNHSGQLGGYDAGCGTSNGY